MASSLLPHFHVSGIHGMITFLFIVAAFGAIHLLCASYPDSRFAQAWTGLGF